MSNVKLSARTGSTKLYFCFPFRGVGGVPLLFSRLGNYLAKIDRFEIYFIDYSDGFLSKQNTSGQCKLLNYCESAPTRIPGDGVLILQSMTPWSIFGQLAPEPNTKLLFWNCHPFNLVPPLPGARKIVQRNKLIGKWILRTLLASYRAKMHRFISILLSNDSLVFMDGVNKEITEEYLDLRILNPVYVPVCMETKNVLVTWNPNRTSQAIRVTWIGRIVDFKFYILKHALYELSRCQRVLGMDIVVNIVGDGPYRKALESYCSKLNSLSISFLDFVEPETGISEFVRKTDLALAMGTSALEFARHGVPTILLDMAYGDVPRSYQFKWLFDSKMFSLANVVDPSNEQRGKDSLLGLIEEYLNKAEELSVWTKSYVDSCHDLEISAQNLLAAVVKTKLKWKDLSSSGLLQRDVPYRALLFFRKFLKSG